MTAYNRNTLIVGIAIALLIGGGLSYFRSESPDGLEKTQEHLGVAEPEVTPVASPPSPFKDYSLAILGEGFWANAAGGVIGCLIVLGIVLGAGHLLKRTHPRPNGSSNSSPSRP
jgi:hypothetical protein